MSRKKTDETPTETPSPLSGEALQARIQELEAKIAAGEEGALKRVCKALGVDPAEVHAKDTVEKEPEPIIRCWVANPVRVNMTVYQGMVEVPKSTFHVIQQAIGDRRMRLLRELTGNNYLLEEIAGPGVSPQTVGRPKLVGQINEHGERIA